LSHAPCPVKLIWSPSETFPCICITSLPVPSV
jgi:hypothetical protein